MEIVNNARFAGRQPFLLGYSATYVKGDADDDAKVTDDVNGSLAESDDILELDMYGSTKWVLTPRNTFEATQAFRYNTGETRFNPTSYITPTGSFLTGSYSSKPEASSESSYSSATSFSLETRFHSGLRSRFNLDNKASFGGSSGSKQTTALEHSLIYQKPKFNYNGITRLLFGDDLASGSLSLGQGNVNVPGKSATNPVEINYIIEHESEVSYSPNRAFESTVSFDYSWIDTDNEDAYRGSFYEQSQYSFYSLSGRIHKVSEIYQEIEYEEYSSNDITASYLKMLAGIGYFPRPFFELGGELLYEAYDPEDIKTLQVSVVASLAFAQMKCETRYSYGLSKVNDASFDEQKEHLFEAKIKRAF